MLPGFELLLARVDVGRARAVLDYLSGAGLPRSCEALREELGLTEYAPDPSKQLLERKWLGVIRAPADARP